MFAGNTLAPGGHPFGFDLDQQKGMRRAVVEAEACLKGMGERHVDLA